jgi:uncharacterized protein (TIGR01244 family)
MKKIIGSTLLAVMMFTASLADEQPPAATMKVDLATVVNDGAVEPVDGMSAAGQPDKAAFEVFASAGYKTVIDMRTEREDRGLDEAAVVTELGMTYINMPVAGLDAISFDNARELDKLLSEVDGPVLLHCGSANRVGALLALRQSLDGATDEDALEYGRAGGMTRLDERVREVLDSK